MRRLAAAVVTALVLCTCAVPGVRHVHAYGGHDRDHADHRHGPAVHQHLAGRPHHGGHDAPVALEACDPGAHAVSMVFTCLSPDPPHAQVPAAVDAGGFVPPRAPWRPALPAEVRAHGPPRLTDAPLRAPPPVVPA